MNCNSSSATIYEEAEGSWARPCDGCYTVPSVVYCPADSAYLCTSCDVRVHTANCVASRHERVCLSEAYEHAPAPVECRTDAAALRAAYEAQVHYANLLAGMHQCVPVVSHPPTAIPAAPLLAEAADTTAILGCKEEEASWLLLSKNSASHYCSGSSSSSAYFAEVDEYFDLTGYNSYYNSHMNNNNRVQYVMQEQQHLQQMQKEYAEKEGSECLVPSQSATVSKPQQSCYAPVEAGQNVYTDPVNSSISFQSMEAGIVPDNTVLDHMAHSSILTPAGARGQLSGPPLHLSSMEREARVLRYREKKKTRSFRKTTRYATRKLYAEARPRIKGRFVKRSEAEIEVDQMFSDGPLYDDTSYSSVPWL